MAEGKTYAEHWSRQASGTLWALSSSCEAVVDDMAWRVCLVLETANGSLPTANCQLRRRPAGPEINFKGTETGRATFKDSTQLVQIRALIQFYLHAAITQIFFKPLKTLIYACARLYAKGMCTQSKGAQAPLQHSSSFFENVPPPRAGIACLMLAQRVP
jgi:hypothetical protein